MAGGHAAGGSIQLAQLIDQYGEHIYRDLHEYAGGLNLVDAIRDDSGYSPRQLLMLIKGLPLESATLAFMRGSEEFRGWSVDQYQRAALIDAVRENTYAFVASNSKRKPSPPEPSYRPKEKVRRKSGNQKSNPFFQRLTQARKIKDARKAQGA